VVACSQGLCTKKKDIMQSKIRAELVAGLPSQASRQKANNN